MAEFAANYVSYTMGASPFQATHGHHPRMDYTNASPQAAGAPVPLNDFMANMTKAHDHLHAEMRFAHDKQQQHANDTRSPAPRLTQGSKVWLSTKKIKTTTPSKKVDHKRLDPFPIDKILSFDPVFHVSLSEAASDDPVDGPGVPPPPPVEIEGHEEWELKEVLDSRLRYRRPKYFVKWLGYDSASCNG